LRAVVFSRLSELTMTNQIARSACSLALTALLLGGASFTSVNRVVEAWLVFYLVAGTLSLFAHMAARAQVSVRL